MSDATGTRLHIRHLALPVAAHLNAAHQRTAHQRAAHQRTAHHGAAQDRAAQDRPEGETPSDQRRELVVVGVGDDMASMHWGECSALNAPTYTSEWAADSFDVLASGDLPDAATHPMARAAIEMALIDRSLCQAGQSLAQSLGSSRERVPIGAVVGLGTIDAVLETIADLAGTNGTGRVKLKVQPGHLTSVATAVRAAFPALSMQLDANGSLGASDLEELISLAELDIEAIEQPFAPTEVALAARLVQACPTPVLADESATDLETIVSLRQNGALSGVVIKPSRLGGIRPALKVLSWCQEEGLHATAGGMLESGLGRHALAALASLDGFTLIGDLSPARRWLADDPWPDLAVTADGAALEVPRTVGVAPKPDLDVLDRYTLRSADTMLDTNEAT